MAMTALKSLLFFMLAPGDLFLEKLVRVLPTLHDKKKVVGIADEVQHSRLGWRCLTAHPLEDAQRAWLGGYLPSMIEGTVRSDLFEAQRRHFDEKE